MREDCPSGHVSCAGIIELLQEKNVSMATHVSWSKLFRRIEIFPSLLPSPDSVLPPYNSAEEEIFLFSLFPLPLPIASFMTLSGMPKMRRTLPSASKDQRQSGLLRVQCSPNTAFPEYRVLQTAGFLSFALSPRGRFELRFQKGKLHFCTAIYNILCSLQHGR